MPSVIINLLIIWLVGRAIANQRSRSRPQEPVQKTIIKSGDRPAQRLRRSLTGSPVKVDSRGAGLAGLAIRKSTDITELAAPDDSSLTASYEDLQSQGMGVYCINDALIQGLVLLQVLGKPKCKRV